MMLRKRYIVGAVFVGAALAAGIFAYRSADDRQSPLPSADYSSAAGQAEPTAGVSEQATRPSSPKVDTHGVSGTRLTEQDESAGGSLDAEDAESRIEQRSRELENATVEHLATALRQAFDEHDDVILNVAKNQLLARAKAGDGAATSAIVAILDGTEPLLQEYLVRVLGEIATVDALRALIDIASHTRVTSERAEGAALQAIAEVGQWRDESLPPEALSSLLERYLGAIPPQDTETISAVARGLSSLGTPKGVSQVLEMLDQLQQYGSSGADTRSRLSEALREVRSPEAVPVLASRLQEDPGLTDGTSRIAGDALAAMGDPHATEVLLAWAAGVTDEMRGEQAIRWLSETRDQGSLNLLLEVSRRTDFRSPALKVRLAVLATKLQQQALPKLSP